MSSCLTQFPKWQHHQLIAVMLLNCTVQSWFTFFASTTVLISWKRFLPLVLATAGEVYAPHSQPQAMQIPWSNWAAVAIEGICFPCPLPAAWQSWPDTQAQPQGSGCDSLLAVPAIAASSTASTPLHSWWWWLHPPEHRSGEKGSSNSCCYYSKRANRCLRLTLNCQAVCHSFSVWNL